MYTCTCSGMHCSSNHVCTCTCAYRYVYMSYLSMCHAPLVHPFSMLPNWPPHSGQARWLAAGWGTLFPTGGPLCVQTRRVSVWGQLPRRGWGFHSVRLLVVASVWQSEPACSPPLPSLSLSSAPPSISLPLTVPRRKASPHVRVGSVGRQFQIDFPLSLMCHTSNVLLHNSMGVS